MDRRSFLLAAASAPFVLRRGIALPHRLAYVTADLQSHVAVVDLDAGAVLHRIPTRRDPRSIERVGETAVVAHTILGALTILHGTDVRHEVEGFAEPRYTAASPDGRHAYVTDSGEAFLATVDVLRGRIVGKVKLKQWPRHLSLARDGRTLWLGLGTASSELAVVDVADPRRPQLVRYRRPPFLVHDVGFSPRGRLWLTAGEERRVSVDGRTIAAGAAPQHVTFLRGNAYVTSGDDGTVRVHGDDGALAHEARIPYGSYNVQFGPGVVFTPSLNAGTLCVLGRDGRVVHEVHVARSSHDACPVPA